MTTSAEIPLPRGKHDKDQRQRALIDAATEVFAEKGYDCATTREVAERACCSEGLIHRYFGGKRGLLLAILERKRQTSGATMRANVPDSDDLAEEVERLIAWSLDFAWESRDFMRVSVAQSIVDPEVGRFIGSELNRERVITIEQKLRRHRDAGRIRADVDVAAIAEAVAGLTFAAGFFLQVVFERDREEVRRLVAHATEVIVRGIERCGDGQAPEGHGRG